MSEKQFIKECIRVILSEFVQSAAKQTKHKNWEPVLAETILPFLKNLDFELVEKKVLEREATPVKDQLAALSGLPGLGNHLLCCAATQTGHRCKREHVDGKFCKQHMALENPKIFDKSDEKDFCAYIYERGAYRGTKCSNFKNGSSCFCLRHQKTKQCARQESVEIATGN